MYARATEFEIDTVRIGLHEALVRFQGTVLPELKRQPGFAGVYVMQTPDGHGLLISLWENAEAAEASVASGFYAEQIAQFVTVMRAPPGREHYEVVHVELPAATNAS